MEKVPKILKGITDEVEEPERFAFAVDEPPKVDEPVKAEEPSQGEPEPIRVDPASDRDVAVGDDSGTDDEAVVETKAEEPQVVDKPGLHLVRTTPKLEPVPDAEPAKAPPTAAKDDVGTAETLHAGGSTPNAPISQSEIIRKISEENVALKADVEARKARVETLTDGIDTRDREISDLKFEVRECRERLRVAQQSLSLKQSENLALYERVERLKEEAERDAEAIERLRRQGASSPSNGTPAPRPPSAVDAKKDPEKKGAGGSSTVWWVLGILLVVTGIAVAVILVTQNGGGTGGAETSATATAHEIAPIEGVSEADLNRVLEHYPKEARGRGTPTCFIPSDVEITPSPSLPVIDCGGKVPKHTSSDGITCYDISPCWIKNLPQAK
ncbi:hypothetical protein L0Y59_01315 [Candidatus Uhrbacteria bacterium]|nr:hypothetical protein [Candidatus Uhrbacteria bacterium]